MENGGPVTGPEGVAGLLYEGRKVVVGLCNITLALHGNRSLKGKRRVIKSMKDRLRAAFNAAVAEVDMLDSLDRAGLGIAVVGNDRPFINSLIDRVINRIEGFNTAEIIDTRIEIMNL